MSIQNMDLWLVIEWVGAILALAGSFIMATHRLNPAYPWILWITSGILYIILFSLKTHQYGLLLMITGGVIANFFGLYQWIKKEVEISKNITNVFFSLSIIGVISATIPLTLFLTTIDYKYLEWAGALTGMSAMILLAARHKYSFLCWFIWLFSNSSLIVLSIHTKQYGILFLQFGYMISNIYGCIQWTRLKNSNFE